MINYKNLDKPALITKQKVYSYSEVMSLIGQFTETFRHIQYDKIAIYSENRPEWVFAFYAGWMAGKVVVPIDFMSSVDDLSFILNDCQPGILFYSNEKRSSVIETKGKLKFNLEFTNFDNLNITPLKQEQVKPITYKPDQTAVIIYTSGTTGSPKGVMLSFRNLEANLKGVCTDVKIYRQDRQVLMLLPLHHIFPLVGTMIAPLYVGASIVVSPSMQSTDLLETLKNNKVAIMIGVPRLYEMIHKGLKVKINASLAGRVFYKLLSTFPNKKLAKKIFKKVHDGFGGNVTIMVTGGAAIPYETIKFYTTLGFTMLDGYGMTEAAPMITFNRPGKIRLNGPGQAMESVQVEIRDGEIVAKGPNIMQGYYNRPEETNQILRDGWLYTGDLGFIDKKGYLHITGRKKEIIVLSNGKNINPVELETKLESASPFIIESAVFEHKNQLHAIICTDYHKMSQAGIKNPDSYYKDELFPAFNEKSTAYKRIMQFTLTKEELPRTRLGKIQRFKLAGLIDKPTRKKSNEPEPETEEYKTIRLFIEEQVGNPIFPDDHLEYDIALDSLGKLGLIDFIGHTFGVIISEAELNKFASVRAIAEHVSEHKLKHIVEQINWSDILKEKVHLSLPKAWPTQTWIKNGSKIFFKLWFRFKVEGAEQIPDEPCIIAANHQSFFDGLFVASFIKRRTMKNTYFYAKKKHVNSWFVRFMAHRNNVIVMDLNNELKESIQKLAEVLRSGRNIIIFPEGTRSKDGQLGDFKRTFAILSSELNVPVVPVAIKGAFEALPKGAIFPRIFSRVHVRFLQPVYPQNHSYDDIRNIVKSSIGHSMKSEV
jgi:long-chain acyl-CoA synthetase